MCILHAEMINSSNPFFLQFINLMSLKLNNLETEQSSRTVMQYIVKVTKGADGKCAGGSGMIKTEQCLCEKGQECQGFRYPGSDVEFRKTTLLRHSCLILCFEFHHLFVEK